MDCFGHLCRHDYAVRPGVLSLCRLSFTCHSCFFVLPVCAGGIYHVSSADPAWQREERIVRPNSTADGIALVLAAVLFFLLGSSCADSRFRNMHHLLSLFRPLWVYHQCMVGNTCLILGWACLFAIVMRSPVFHLHFYGYLFVLFRGAYVASGIYLFVGLLVLHKADKLRLFFSALAYCVGCGVLSGRK